ncbi:hypothetical protein FSU_2717 [Fibrobacter succinogenes subsp. succinogenes S85]|uniref:Uncharacterized protein n=1 Tax=Fibrobacter succinogenes (strain ATCC 19169 / S85) TaxID=59374 RepID=D9S6B0_FIBSS|nr:hypothetical protein FSU_2717 [Fibrobacter succinogenes subsp. succinogenes S85]
MHTISFSSIFSITKFFKKNLNFYKISVDYL